MTYVAYVNFIEDMPDSIQLWIQIYIFFCIIWIHCAAPRSSVQGLQLPPTLRLAVVARFLRSDAAFWKKGRAFAFLLVALAAGRGGKTPSAFTALLPCFAKAFAARQTAAFTKPKGRNMKQTTISKALLYARLDLLKVMFSVALLPKINFIINLAYYRQVARCTQSPCNIY